MEVSFSLSTPTFEVTRLYVMTKTVDKTMRPTTPITSPRLIPLVDVCTEEGVVVDVEELVIATTFVGSTMEAENVRLLPDRMAVTVMVYSTGCMFSKQTAMFLFRVSVVSLQSRSCLVNSIYVHIVYILGDYERNLECYLSAVPDLDIFSSAVFDSMTKVDC